MPKFKCVNEECINKEKEITIPQVSFRYDEIQNKLIPLKKYLCLVCGKEMQYVEEVKSGIQGFCFTKFNTLSSDQKKEVLHKRSQNHFKKKEEKDLREYKRQILEQNRKMFGGK